jgi:hypothetical protein
LLDAIETSSLAIAIRDSLPITALLSGAHLVGMTFAVGSALVLALQLAGRAVPGVPDDAVRRPVGRILLVAVALSATTGLLMALPRAGNIVYNPTFRWKMTLLAGALIAHAVLRLVRSRPALPLVAASHFLLWGAVAVFGAMFTLLE